MSSTPRVGYKRPRSLTSALVPQGRMVAPFWTWQHAACSQSILPLSMLPVLVIWTRQTQKLIRSVSGYMPREHSIEYRSFDNSVSHYATCFQQKSMWSSDGAIKCMFQKLVTTNRLSTYLVGAESEFSSCATDTLLQYGYRKPSSSPFCGPQALLRERQAHHKTYTQTSA